MDKIRISNTVLKILVGASAATLIYKGCCFIVKEWQQNERFLSGSPLHKVIFFPDEKVACRDEFTARHGCTSPVCKFSHDSELSYAQLMSALGSAELSVDVCVFCFTASELGSILREMSKRGVRVRVITDSDQINASGTQIGSLRKDGIQVRHDGTTFFMHHKFAVIDNKLLINGSFNWTRAAITGNFENLLLTNNQSIVQPYITEFEKLWIKFDPRQRKHLA